MTHAEHVAKLLQLIRQANSQEIGLLLQVADWLRQHRDTLSMPTKPGELAEHALALLTAAGRGLT